MSANPFVTVGNRLHEVLGRKRLEADHLSVGSPLAGKRILITGAGGSIGSALSAAIARLDVAGLTLLDAHENSLFHLKEELSNLHPEQPLRYALADVRNAHRMRRVIEEARPDVIFHLAAYKHVPMAEELPSEFVAVNVLATWQLIEEARRAGVRKIVYPSTDKAVNPPSVYGATKRSAELIFRAAAAAYPELELTVARLVNVLGAAGGVIETFVRQIESGQAVTVTDARMTRYWITMDEALMLVVTSAVADATGKILLLDLGEPVNVAMVAERLWTMLRRDEPRIVFFGSRPGERLAEELAYGHERLIRSDYPFVLQAHQNLPSPSLQDLLPSITELRELEHSDNATLRDHLFSFVQRWS